MKHLTCFLVASCLALALPSFAFAQETPPETVDQPPENVEQRFIRRVAGTETCLICHGGYNIIASRGSQKNESLWIDSEVFMQSVHARLGCTACHTNIDPNGHRLADHVIGDQTEDENAKHSEAVHAAGQDTLTHKLHDRAKRTPALMACVGCHQEVYEKYKQSVHGVSVLTEGKAEPPFCNDCHGFHEILPPEDERALTNPANIPGTCQRCHAQADIKKRYGLTKDVAETFEHSFHGRRGEMGSQNVAVCTSCHGWHDIYRAEDPRSRVNSTQVSQTCGGCHQGAQRSFASAFTHGKVSRTELVGVYAITQTHKWMIVLIIAPLVGIVLLDIYRSYRLRAAKRNE